MCRRNGKNNNNNNNEMYIIFHKVMRLSCAMYSISIAQSIPKKQQKKNVSHELLHFALYCLLLHIDIINKPKYTH